MYNLVEHVEAVLDIHGRSAETIKWAGFSGILGVDWPTFKEKTKEVMVAPENGVNLNPGLIVMGDTWFMRVTENSGLTEPELEFIEIPTEGPYRDIMDANIVLDEIPA